MLEGVCGYDGKTYSVKPTCNVIENWDYDAAPDGQRFCGKRDGDLPPSAEHNARDRW